MVGMLNLVVAFLLIVQIHHDAVLSLRLDFESLLHGSAKCHVIGPYTGIHLPLYRQEKRNWYQRNNIQGGMGEVGLGDYIDVTYNVLVALGNATIPLIIVPEDTGSSDLWAISKAFATESPTHVPLYPEADFQSAGIDVRLEYGDSSTGTYAHGLIGNDTVSLAGFTMQNQYFAAINDTNTTVLQTGSAGILGLGFPLNSVVWKAMFLSKNAISSQADGSMNARRQSSLSEAVLQFPSRVFPDIKFLIPSLLSPPSDHPSHQHHSNIIHDIISSFATLGPFLPRLVASRSLALPLFTILLQRDTIDVSGNPGVLSIGGLPPGIEMEDLFWTEVRAYPRSQGGLGAPSNAPGEMYPIAWEIPIDDIFLDGQKLPRSSLSSPNITLSALIDTGNSLIRGPSDVIQAIYNTIGNTTFPCSIPHTLAFQISGRIFPVDPRDFARQACRDTVALCEPNLAVTDSPEIGNGYLYSWSLGDPFLKSVLASFYYGNLSYPSRDPPRIGLLSTVSSDANAKMESAVSTWHGDGNFPATSEPAPSGTSTQTDPSRPLATSSLLPSWIP